MASLERMRQIPMLVARVQVLSRCIESNESKSSRLISRFLCQGPVDHVESSVA